MLDNYEIYYDKKLKELCYSDNKNNKTPYLTVYLCKKKNINKKLAISIVDINYIREISNDVNIDGNNKKISEYYRIYKAVAIENNNNDNIDVDNINFGCSIYNNNYQRLYSDVFREKGILYIVTEYEIQLTSNYYINRWDIIGSGQFSNVYGGKHIKDKIPFEKLTKDNFFNIEPTTIKIAIKKLNIEKMKNIDIIKNEIEITNFLKTKPHKNIVKYYDTIQNKNGIFIVMEYCEHGDLSSILGKPLREEFIKYYSNQIKEGMQHIHNLNITHRDIKPKNILFPDKKSLKIADFGLAKINTIDEVYSTICGSPMYMAPEINGSEYSDAVDIWSFGIILYEMAFGVPPDIARFGESITLEKIKNSKYDEIMIPPIEFNDSDLSDDFLDLIRHILENNVDNRITWEEFYTNKWLLDIGNYKSNKKSNKNVVIINDYLDNMLEFDNSNWKFFYKNNKNKITIENTKNIISM